MSKPIALVVSDIFEPESAVRFALNQPRDFVIVDKLRIDLHLASILETEAFEYIYRIDEAHHLVQNEIPKHFYVLTSGTTGKPKLIRHDIEKQNTFNKLTDFPALTWFVPAQIGSFAWYQMIFLQRFVADQQLILPNSSNMLEAFKKGIADKSFNAISSTSTFMKYVSLTLGIDFFKGNSVERITLGGEIITQSDIDLCLRMFPKARITHIYASSELGPIFTSNDLLAGYTLSKYKYERDFKIVDGELIVRSKFNEKESAWNNTGDLAEIVANRIHIIGRKNHDFVNVGGSRVNLKKIERLLELVNGVSWVRAYPIKSHMMGHIIGVEVTIESGLSSEQVEIEIDQYAREFLSEAEIPREIQFTKNFEIRESLKK